MDFCSIAVAELKDETVLADADFPAPRPRFSDEFVDQIMSLIANGDLRPGQRLPCYRNQAS
jgi:hypothetical protein